MNFPISLFQTEVFIGGVRFLADLFCHAKSFGLIVLGRAWFVRAEIVNQLFITVSNSKLYHFTILSHLKLYHGLVFICYFTLQVLLSFSSIPWYFLLWIYVFLKDSLPHSYFCLLNSTILLIVLFLSFSTCLSSFVNPICLHS